MTKLNQKEWDLFLESQPDNHIMQTNAWGMLKSAFGWKVERIQSGINGTLILFRRLPFGKSIGYIPKALMKTPWDEFWKEIDAVSKQNQTIFLKFEPDMWEKNSPEQIAEINRNVYPSTPVQPRRTILVNLTGTEQDWLQRMKQKTRYNIRLAEKKGITIHQSSDVDSFYDLIQVTGKRDKFGVHSKVYYQKAFDLFYKDGKCALLEAKYGDVVVGGLMAFCHNRRAWYFYGASSDLERNRMPTYLLQWEAMRWAASRGCVEYDLWGIPDFDESELEESFNTRSEDLWGVYRFKRGFGGEVVRSVGAYDRIYKPAYYRLYTLYVRYFRNAGVS